LRCDKQADRRLARAHESGECEIPDVTSFDHRVDLPYRSGAGTQFLGFF
jgi:hypothetical protein